MNQKNFLQIRVIFIVLCLIAIAGIYFFINKTTPTVASLIDVKITQNQEVKKEVKNEPKQEIKTEVTTVSVGDIFLHDNNLLAAYDSKKKTYNFDSAFSVVAEYLKEADLSTAHVGGVIDPKGPYSGYPAFRSPVAFIDALQNIGLDIAFRTNHTLDFGTKGFNTTSEILKNHNINQVAAHTTEEESKKYMFMRKII